MGPTEPEARAVASPSPLADLRAEVGRLLDAARAAGVLLRATGGLAVWLRCPTARRPPLARDYKDLDFVGRAGEAHAATELLARLGYEPDVEFNSLHGHHRLYFWDPVHGRQLDVFIDRMRMSHELDLEGRIGLEDTTIPLADLLLTKLQVVEVNEKDLKDASAILADHEIGAGGIGADRIAAVTSSDWGWWRTATETLDKVVAYAERVDGFDAAQDVRRRAAELRSLLESTPKSLKWKLRARIGERARWYELPEEIEG
jgi:hypothetical protein